MKKIIKLCFIIFFVFLTSCVTETENQRIDYNFEISNNSGKNIRIIAFKNSIFTRETDISNNTTYNKSFTSSSMDRAYFFSDVLGGDSIKIIYGNEKVQFFKCFRNNADDGCTQPRNILSVFEDNDDNNQIFLNQYTFTENDYENAEECNGNCE